MKIFSASFSPFSATSFLSICAALAVSALPSRAVTVAGQATVTAGAPGATAPAQHALSSSVDEVVKMVDAGVDKAVITAFIQNSHTTFTLNASDIIALKDRGVDSEILTSM